MREIERDRQTEREERERERERETLSVKSQSCYPHLLRCVVHAFCEAGLSEVSSIDLDQTGTGSIRPDSTG